MKKIAALIRQLEQADQIVHLRFEQERAQLTERYLLQLLSVYQKVSLAEIRVQVKNARSPMSSTNDENLLH